MKYLDAKELPWVVERIQEGAKIDGMNKAAKQQSFPLRPSSALRPLRDLYYGLVNYYQPGSIPTDPIEGRNTMLLSLGHAIERHLIEYVEKSFAVTARNQRVVYGQVKGKGGEVINLSGEFDFQLTSSKTGETIIADSKSSADYPFKSSVPKDEHMAQINLYLHSDWARSRNINKAWIIYYNKNNSDLRVYEFEYSKEKAEEVIARFQSVMDAYLKGEIPQRESVYGLDWQAAYSSYKTFDLREFTLPLDQRVVIEHEDDEQIDSLDREELVRYLALNSGGKGAVHKSPVRRVWLELGATKLMLKEEKLNGKK